MLTFPYTVELHSTIQKMHGIKLTFSHLLCSLKGLFVELGPLLDA